MSKNTVQTLMQLGQALLIIFSIVGGLYGVHKTIIIEDVRKIIVTEAYAKDRGESLEKVLYDDIREIKSDQAVIRQDIKELMKKW